MSDKKIMFYHANETSTLGVLYELLKKSFVNNKKSLVIMDTIDNMAHISEQLWAYQDDFILPHGLITETMPQHQPILLTQSLENINDADYIFFIGQVTITDAFNFERYIVIFDDKNEDIKNHMRESYKTLKKAQKPIVYYQQQSGKWVLK